MSGTRPMEVVGVVGVFVLLIIVITVIVWQLASTWRARVSAQREEAYRVLAADAVRAHEAAGTRLAAMDERLTAIDRRLTAIEGVLKQVE